MQSPGAPATGQAVRADFLDLVPLSFIWVARLAWALTGFGLARRLVGLARGAASVA